MLMINIGRCHDCFRLIRAVSIVNGLRKTFVRDEERQ